MDNLDYSAGSVAAGAACRCGWVVDSPVACDCRDRVGFQPYKRPTEGDLSGNPNASTPKPSIDEGRHLIPDCEASRLFAD